MANYVLLDPVAAIQVEDTGPQKTIVPLDTLKGKSIGFLFDGHYSAVDYWAFLQKKVTAHFTPMKVVSHIKPNVGAPATKEMIDQVTSQVDVAIVGVGA
ncbi:MAG: hypothetical protein Q7T26_11580 [Dehalococcoidia bacterium]|nr:hypothetical protein [Dehalococcoidia bacterium]